MKSQRYEVTARSTQKTELWVDWKLDAQGAKKENTGLSEIKDHENK